MQEQWLKDWARWQAAWRESKAVSQATRTLLGKIAKRRGDTSLLPNFREQAERVLAARGTAGVWKELKALRKEFPRAHEDAQIGFVNVSPARAERAWKEVGKLLASRPMVLPAVKREVIATGDRRLRKPFAYYAPTLDRKPTPWDELTPALVCGQCLTLGMYFGGGQAVLFPACHHCGGAKREFDALAVDLRPDDWLFWATKLNDAPYEPAMLGILGDWLEDRGWVLEVARLRAVQTTLRPKRQGVGQ